MRRMLPSTLGTLTASPPPAATAPSPAPRRMLRAAVPLAMLAARHRQQHRAQPGHRRRAGAVARALAGRPRRAHRRRRRDGDGRSHRFLESVGCGLVTACIDEGHATLAKDDPKRTLPRRANFTWNAARHGAAHYDITIDDERISRRLPARRGAEHAVNRPAVRTHCRCQCR